MVIRIIEANFEGGARSSDGGLMLLRQADRNIGLSAAEAAALHDPRYLNFIVHALHDLMAQRRMACADPASERPHIRHPMYIGSARSPGKQPQNATGTAEIETGLKHEISSSFQTFT